MANPSGSRAEAAYTRAATAFQQGSFDLAKQFVTEALTADPGHPGARALRTRIEARLSAGPAAGRAGQPPGGSGRAPRSPEATSVDPTILIDRAAHRPVEYVEPTVMIQRDDYRREDTNPPQPAPASRPAARPAPEPTVLISSSKSRPTAPPAGAGSGGFFQRVKDLSGGAPPPKRPASRGAAPARQPGGFWTPATRGAALAIGGVVIASLFVAMLVVLVRWMWPSGNTLTVQRPTGGTIVGSGLECGTRGSDCLVTRPPDDTVTLQPVPDSGYVFSGFTGDCAPSGRVLMTQARSCGATFGAIGSAEGPGGPVMRTLTIRKPTGGTIVGEGISCGTLGSICTTTLSDGMAVALNIQTDPGFQFEQFTGDCTAEGQVTMSSSRECGASFAQPPAPIATTPGRRPDPPAPQIGRRGNQGTPPAPGTPVTGGPPGPSGASPSGQGGTPQPASPPAPPPGPPTPAPTPGPTGTVAGPGEAGQKPPTAEISAEAHAKKEIDQLIKNYCAALQTMQPNKLKELYPQVDVATHRELFRQYKSLKCALAGDLEYERLDASPAGFAQVKAGMKQQFEMKTGGAPKVAELIYTLRVSRLSNNSPWMIERILVEPKPK